MTFKQPLRLGPAKVVVFQGRDKRPTLHIGYQPPTLKSWSAAPYQYEGGKWKVLDSTWGTATFTDGGDHFTIVVTKKDGENSLSSTIHASCVSKKTSKVFFQWKDATGTVYGVNFRTEDELATFAERFEQAIVQLKTALPTLADLPPPIALPPAIESTTSSSPSTPTSNQTPSPNSTLTAATTASLTLPPPIATGHLPASPNSSFNSKHSSSPRDADSPNSSSSSFNAALPPPALQSSKDGVTSPSITSPDSNRGSPVGSLRRTSSNTSNTSSPVEDRRSHTGEAIPTHEISLTFTVSSSQTLRPDMTPETRSKSHTLKTVKEKVKEESSSTFSSKKSKKGSFFGSVRKSKILDPSVSGIGVNIDTTEWPLLAMLPVSELSPRDLVVREMYTSEATYHAQLQSLVTGYIQPAKAEKVFTDFECKDIFSNVEILKKVSEDILKGLREPLDDWSPTQKVAYVLKNMAPVMKMYITYCINYDSSLAKLEESKKRNSVQNFLKSGEKENPSLQTLLITPVQRLPRWVLLLRELLRKTPPEHPDFDDITEAQTKISEIVGQLNENVRKSETVKKLNELLKDRTRFSGLEALVLPHREFLRDAPFELCIPSDQPKRSHWGVLFDDTLVLTYEVGHQGPSMVAVDIPLASAWVKMSSSIVEIVTPDFNFTTSPLGKDGDSQTNNAWINAIQEAQKNLFNNSHTVKQGLMCTEGGLRRFSHVFWRGERAKDSYDGEWVDGQMEGQGTYKSESFKYTGQFKNGKMHGQGLIEWTGGTSYQGDFDNNLPHGKGVLTSPYGVYTGEVLDARRWGQGTMKWTDGTFYEGQWYDDAMSGKGELRTADGRHVYTGEHSQGRFHGQGKLVTSEEMEYEGNWVEGMREGQGSMIYKQSGETYTGAWKANQRDGDGILTSNSGEKIYDGKWEKDRRNGRGKSFVDGIYEGYFVDDRREGRVGAIVWKNKDQYMGSWKSDKPDGKGRLSKANGEKYTGNFVEGFRHGEGETSLPASSFPPNSLPATVKPTDDVVTFKGTYNKNKRHGRGEWRSFTGELWSGEWVNDDPQGLMTVKRLDGSTYTVEFTLGRQKYPTVRVPMLRHEREGNGSTWTLDCRGSDTWMHLYLRFSRVKRQALDAVFVWLIVGDSANFDEYRTKYGALTNSAKDASCLAEKICKPLPIARAENLSLLGFGKRNAIRELITFVSRQLASSTAQGQHQAVARDMSADPQDGFSKDQEIMVENNEKVIRRGFCTLEKIESKTDEISFETWPVKRTNGYCTTL
ncbi:hypothetical protein PROFUN_06556 [Planoprotostelium fungivorum]|uniref:DH domain-containing protein n=1 Tax=Planoprotostelium fungivorum TaxID=1890364 RepID=A0A2P6MRV2_9EUKA|nr:hypothetical protein PROFUN_06556 [Planoprotostelium fungivorum]